MLARFYNEVRIARQVTHPNVCRVFDIGDVEGQPFISMQFVDGENLASLLLRIGRLPADKAVEISRRLCAGLAAAHSQGVLHRDLKPANIMIDGRGQVLITDFGLAGLEEEIRGADIHSGTPAYMAPEQLAGKEVTSKSDIYALGLVMYEIFTGKRAFEADTLADLIRMRGESRPSEMSSSVRDVDPAVERIILKCLDPDPAKRPSGALAVSAALPGGDPLAAALAAGETPSPEMVAAAGAQEGLKPAIAIACLAAILIALAAIVYFDCRQELAGMVNFELPPEALAVQARKTIQQFGYTGAVADRRIHLRLFRRLSLLPQAELQTAAGLDESGFEPAARDLFFLSRKSAADRAAQLRHPGPRLCGRSAAGDFRHGAHHARPHRPNAQFLRRSSSSGSIARARAAT